MLPDDLKLVDILKQYARFSKFRDGRLYYQFTIKNYEVEFSIDASREDLRGGDFLAEIKMMYLKRWFDIALKESEVKFKNKK